MARSRSRSRPGRRAARRADPAAPTPERLGHDPHERAEIVDPQGRSRRAWRALDTVEQMRIKGALGAAQVGVARRFQEQFRQAGLDPLAARGFERRQRGYGGDERALSARERVARMIAKLGGHGSLLAQVVWHVLGACATLEECARRLQWGGGSVGRKAIAGVLIAALDLLARGGA